MENIINIIKQLLFAGAFLLAMAVCKVLVYILNQVDRHTAGATDDEEKILSISCRAYWLKKIIGRMTNLQKPHNIFLLLKKVALRQRRHACIAHRIIMLDLEMCKGTLTRAWVDSLSAQALQSLHTLGRPARRAETHSPLRQNIDACPYGFTYSFST